MSIYSAALIFFLIMDPFGNIPVFLSILESVEPRRRKWIIIREMLIALGVLLIFLFMGNYILLGLQISEPALSVAGGVLLFLISIKMIFPGQYHQLDSDDETEPIIVPLAVPLIAGPSAMTMVILLSAKYPEKIWQWFIALCIAWAVSSLVLILSELLRKLLGRPVLKAIERLMGMILTTISVQMLLTGIREFLTKMD